MFLEHLGIWVDNLEKMRSFYMTHFNVSSGEKYTNPVKGFTSYFLTFDGGGARIELMNKTGIAEHNAVRGLVCGLAHFAIMLPDMQAVDELTSRLRGEKVTIVSEPRMTGDGYYESIISDPEGNWIELIYRGVDNGD